MVTASITPARASPRRSLRTRPQPSRRALLGRGLLLLGSGLALLAGCGRKGDLEPPKPSPTGKTDKGQQG